MTSVAALCGLVLMVGGAPFRFPERVVAIASYLAYDPSETFRSGRCYLADAVIVIRNVDVADAIHHHGSRRV